jgi:threonine/homoserine/homoserine lactone efflux protein
LLVPYPSLALFTAAAALLIVMPGPAVLYIVARSVHQGRRAGLVSALGVATGGLVHIAAAVLGFSALLASSAVAFSAVRWLGALYLVMLGIRTLRAPLNGGVGAPPPSAGARRIYVQGVLVNVLNPKTALFFLAFLPQFVDPARGQVAAQLLLLGGLFITLALASDSAYALLAGSLGERLGRTAAARRGARLATGSVYLALGVGTAVSGARLK